MHTYIHTCIHTYIHTYIHTDIHTDRHTYIHTCAHQEHSEALASALQGKETELRETQDTLAKRSEQCRQLYDIVGTLEQRLGHLPEQPDNAPAHHAKGGGGGGGGGDGAMGAGSHGQVPAVVLIYGRHIRQTYKAQM